MRDADCWPGFGELSGRSLRGRRSRHLIGDALMSNAGRRFVQEALEDLNLRTTPIVVIERAGFVPIEKQAWPLLSGRMRCAR